ncbi:hypothetical protein [Nocardioides ferulae]|uniref:hypothetical protein n=1 Tax=Nocardioides ferulae TaxID=2340821 RepID=UPI000F86D229|nr:hypothetical protein [Nocardioides ferulae]
MPTESSATVARSKGRRAPALVAVVVLLGALLTAAPASAEIEDYPSWQPATKCQPKPKPGTAFLGRWLVRNHGGSFGSISRSCTKKNVSSEHHEGRAFDWSLDAAKKADRRRARAFLAQVRATDARGNTDAVGRRMGLMYVIWNDEIYSAWNGYAPEPYLSSSCKTRKKCSKTLRHRDHVHVSLTRAGGRGKTSWFERRMG